MIDFKKGGNQKKMIVVHHTGSVSTLQAMLNFFKKSDSISIHYIVDKDGRVAKHVEENDIAFHAGKSQWGNWKDINPVSIGIEIISNGTDFTDSQRDSVLNLCKDIMKRNNISKNNVVTHADVAMPRGRKWDVGPNFYVPRWGSWEAFQNALDDNNSDLSIAEAEKELADAMEEAQEKLAIVNKKRQNLVKLKGVKFFRYEIIDTKKN